MFWDVFLKLSCARKLPGELIEGRFGFSISKKLPRDAKDAGPHFWVSREHMKVSLLRGGW